MAVIEIKSTPSKRELSWFGAVMLVFFGAVGSVAYFKFHAPTAAYVLWSVGTLLALLFYAIPPLRIPLYLGWMRAFFPVGWTFSHLVLIVIYYLVVTPIGLVMRLFGYDPMKRRLDPGAATYWVEHRTAAELARYFRQY
ncbi:MAG: SxtJ family membrane protein [Candidatus Krumholzibacteriia bacterium]